MYYYTLCSEISHCFLRWRDITSLVAVDWTTRRKLWYTKYFLTQACNVFAIVIFPVVNDTDYCVIAIFWLFSSLMH